ncbi:hypothetical protein GNI_235200 [Gregarina niphandrodes]|uniref:Reverse transcriptase/retrotransposon-derived protein RNase H-like domain-containing protein n=1 Tax=Gregarina niphandrodes TaxID=110365 RepID=A0A023AW99_GRENI|nr:hypothetical protein GNI_235200 [Gregarina niphandrodes]EZG42713.1 hypothetical protein GNI_235200 [Gregarina niphandrodes]|eukprot:XP_011134781.1 hypothetical protein GNI_235200 [Gregarina niphandrodes]
MRYALLAEKYEEQPPVVEELLEDPFERQRQVFVEGTGHLDQSLRDGLWNLLVAYRDVRENPKVACVKYEARFEASGKPCKARLRHLEPELRTEIIIVTDTVPEMMQRLEKVLRLCRERGFRLRLDKGGWLNAEVLNAPAPASRKELQSFLGAVGYLRPFIQRFAEYTAPLFELLKKGRLFVWSDSRGEAFVKLKQAVAGASLLHKPVPGAPVIIETDASEVGIGAVLKQVQEGREVPLEFASKKFTDAERKSGTTT